MESDTITMLKTYSGRYLNWQIIDGYGRTNGINRWTKMLAWSWWAKRTISVLYKPDLIPYCVQKSISLLETNGLQSYLSKGLLLHISHDSLCWDCLVVVISSPQRHQWVYIYAVNSFWYILHFNKTASHSCKFHEHRHALSNLTSCRWVLHLRIQLNESWCASF